MISCLILCCPVLYFLSSCILFHHLIHELFFFLFSFSGLDATDFEGEDEDISMSMDQDRSVNMFRGREGGRDRVRERNDLDISISSVNSHYLPSNQLNITQSSLTNGLNSLDINTSRNIKFTESKNQNIYHKQNDENNNLNKNNENCELDDYSLFEGDNKKIRYNQAVNDSDINIYQIGENSFDKTVNEDITISNKKRSNNIHCDKMTTIATVTKNRRRKK